ncbi:MAG: hypothetical protein QNJ94_24130 [Alphaproteobacteria bacterium]|nr:hypothetical protein [Alphaproteobacteria bacterium]
MDTTERRLKVWEIGVRAVGPIVVGVLIAYFAHLGDFRLKQIDAQMKSAEMREARLTTATQIANAQKELETNIATKLWEDLVGVFFPESEGLRTDERIMEQMFRLRLTALNFQDIAINLKPFFEHLDAKLPNGDARKRLQEYAQEVAGRQAYRLAFEAGNDFGEIPVTLGDPPTELPVPKKRDEPTKLTITEIEDDYVKVKISAPGQRDIGPFQVSFFDMPLVDNVKLKALGTRLALLLIATNKDQKAATLRVVTFQPYMAADRFDLKEQARVLGTRDFRNEGVE